MPVFKLINGILQLLVKHAAIGDNDDAIKNASVLFVMQRSQAVSQPSNGIALAAAR